MKYGYSILRKFLHVFAMLLLSNVSYALTGAQIIEKADAYRAFTWTCNDWNARQVNNNGSWDKTRDDGGKDWRYPFFPVGEPIGPDPDGDGPQAAPTSTGQYTGEAYGYGLGDTEEIFKSKLTDGYLVGNIGTQDAENKSVYEYAGIDCSGFVSRCLGFPKTRINSSHPYMLLHPSTDILYEAYFTDPIKIIVSDLDFILDFYLKQLDSIANEHIIMT
jgi:hypothetical protein